VSLILNKKATMLSKIYLKGNEKTMKKLSIFAAILMLAITVMMVVPFPSEGATLTQNTGQYLTLPTHIPTFLYVDAAPDPVGQGQTCYLSAIFSKPVPTSHGLLGDMFLGITIKVTDPNGVVTTLGPHDGGMIGGWATSFTPTIVGQYTVQAFYPGQVLTGTNPYNSDPTTQDYHPELNGSTMDPSNSTIVTFTVQSDPITSQYQSPALPTQYWTRPILALNWNWGAEVASNWLGLDATGFCTSGKYDATGCFQPYGLAPNTAHILWSKSTREGGQPGGPITSDPSTQFTSTSVVINMYDGMIIMNGIGYYTDHISWSGQITTWTAVDLKTGATVWKIPAGLTGAENLKCGFLFDFHNAQEFGSVAYLMTTPDAAGVTRLYDAWTGTFQANITSSRNLAMIVDDYARKTEVPGDYNGFNQIGGLLGWYVENNQLKRWNSTALFTTVGANLQARTKVNGPATYNWTNGVDQVIQLPTLSLGYTGYTSSSSNATLGVAAVTKEVILLRYSPTFYYQGSNFGWQETMGIDAVTGKTLWGPFNQSLPFLEDTSIIAARDGVYVIRNKDTNTLTGYDLQTGLVKWGPVDTLYNANTPLDIFSDIAYGKVYLWDMGGIVQTYDLNTGTRVWNWTRGSSGYDDQRGVYELFGYRSHSIADGKLFLQEGVMYTPPVHPARRTVLNCTDGTLVWDILSYSARSGSPIADGVLTEWDSYDCKIYAFGQGPTQTTVTAPDAGVPFGTKVMIKGSVMDISAGVKQEGVIENFPAGVPAVSDASVTHWMEYVYKQQPKPTNATGVMVDISVLDGNNNFRSIGTAITRADGTFSFAWNPDISGTFTVYATFAGSQAYYGSSATSGFAVESAPEHTAAPTASPSSLADQYFLPVSGGIIVAIILVGAVLALLLRKR
jgi:hypothetical protein